MNHERKSDAEPVLIYINSRTIPYDGGSFEMAGSFHQNGLPLGRVQRDPGDQDRTAMEVSGKRVVEVARQPVGRQSQTLSRRAGLNNLRQFAAITENVVLSAYYSPRHVPQSRL